MSKTRPTCSIPGCERPVMTLASGWCSPHYQRARTHGGDPLAGRSMNGEAMAYFQQQLWIKTDECKLWPYSTITDGSGRRRYGHLWIPGTGKKRLVHVMACEAWHGPRPGPAALFDACHSCGEGLCFHGGHLRWDTREGNMADQLVHGTRNRGERNGQAQITEDAVREIRRRYAAGERPRFLAAEYGVTATHIGAIARREKWKHLAD